MHLLDGINFSSDLVGRLFPAYFTADGQGVISSLGPSLSRRFGRTPLGYHIFDWFHPVGGGPNPCKFDLRDGDILNFRIITTPHIVLRCFVSIQNKGIVFLSSYIVGGDSAGQYSFGDFSPVDCTAELVVVNALNDELRSDALKLAGFYQSERDRAKSLSAAKSRLIADVSHEIRNPLNGILGLAKILELSASEETVIEVSKKISESGYVLKRIIDDIIDLSKIESKTVDLELLEFTFSEIGDMLDRQIEALVIEDGVSIIKSFIPDPYMGDKARIYQILSNLVMNAINYTKSGFIWISVGEFAVSGGPDGGPGRPGVEIIVKDTGIGIEADKMQNIFEPFVQVHAREGGRIEGVGLGLSVVSTIVQAMGGDIKVESEVGRGTEFKVRLPLDPAANQSAPRGGSRLHKRRKFPRRDTGPCVLLAEDDSTNRFVFGEYLRMKKTRVLLANDGLQALRLYREHNPDLVFLDIRMPLLDGIEVCRQIRQFEQLHSMRERPIYAATANVMQQQLEEYKAAGFYGVLKKPIDFSEVDKILSKTS